MINYADPAFTARVIAELRRIIRGNKLIPSPPGVSTVSVTAQFILYTPYTVYRGNKLVGGFEFNVKTKVQEITFSEDVVDFTGLTPKEGERMLYQVIEQIYDSTLAYVTEHIGYVFRRELEAMFNELSVEQLQTLNVNMVKPFLTTTRQSKSAFTSVVNSYGEYVVTYCLRELTVEHLRKRRNLARANDIR